MDMKVLDRAAAKAVRRGVVAALVLAGLLIVGVATGWGATRVSSSTPHVAHKAKLTHRTVCWRAVGGKKRRRVACRKPKSHKATRSLPVKTTAKKKAAPKQTTPSPKQTTTSPSAPFPLRLPLPLPRVVRPARRRRNRLRPHPMSRAVRRLGRSRG